MSLNGESLNSYGNNRFPRSNRKVSVKCLQTIEELKKSCDNLGIKFDGCTKTMLQVDFILDDDEEGFYLVKWRGRGSKYNSWEPPSKLSQSKEVLLYYNNIKNPADMLSEEMILYFIDDLVTRKPHDILTITQLYALVSGYDVEKINNLPFSYLKGEIMKCLDDEVKKNELFGHRDKLLGLMKLFEKRKNVLSLLKEWETEINARSSIYVKVENNRDLERPPGNFEFVSNYVSSYVDLTENPVVFCSCVNCYKNCNDCCAHHLDGKFAYNKEQCLRLPMGHPIYECNKLCKCGKSCLNRVVQNGPKVKVAIFRTGNGCGWGLKALETVKKGQFVLEYLGEVISFEQAEVRGEVYNHLGRTYLFDMGYGEDQCYTIDAMLFGNASHFINHSCDPNLITYCVFINQQDPRLPRIALFAKKKIKPGEELTFDYKIGSKRSVYSEDSQITCKCNSKNCRKYIF